MSHLLVKISLQRRTHIRLKMVLPVIKQTIMTFLSEILNLERHLNRWIGSKVTASLLNGWIWLLVEFHWEGSVLQPAQKACLKFVLSSCKNLNLSCLPVFLLQKLKIPPWTQILKFVKTWPSREIKNLDGDVCV